MLDKFIGKKTLSFMLDHKALILGIVMLIASFGLLLGSIACTIASLLLIFVYQTDIPLVYAMMLGFWITWVLAVATGIILVKS